METGARAVANRAPPEERGGDDAVAAAPYGAALLLGGLLLGGSIHRNFGVQQTGGAGPEAIACLDRAVMGSPIVEEVWKPPTLPWCTTKSIWVADADGQPEEVPLRSPRLVQASKDVGVPFDELVVRELSEFRERGLSKDVVKVRWELFEQRRVAKLSMVVKTRLKAVRKDEAVAQAAKEAAMGSPQFDVRIEVAKGPSMMEKAQAGMQKMLQTAAHRDAQAEKAQAESEALLAQRAEAQAVRNGRAEERERTRALEVEKRRRAAAREERKRAQQKEEDEEQEKINDQRLLEAFAARQVQLEQAIAQRKVKYEERRAAGIRVQQRAQARVARRQEAVQMAKEEMIVAAEAKARLQTEAVRLKREEAHAEMLVRNEKKMAEQAIKLAASQDKEVAKLEAQKIRVEEMQEEAAKRVDLAKQRQIDRVAEATQRRLDLAARKRDRQRVIAGAVIRMKEQAQLRADEKVWQQEDRQLAIQQDRAVRAERNRMRLENKLDEVRRINRQKDYLQSQAQQLSMQKKEKIAEHIAQKKEMFAETRKLVIDAQYQKERAALEESLAQWRPKGVQSGSSSADNDDDDHSKSDDGDDTAGPRVGRSKSQSWVSKRLTSGEPLFETGAHRRRSMAMLDPIIVNGRDRQLRLNAMLDFRPNKTTMKHSTLPSPRANDNMSKSTLSTLVA